MKKLIQYCTVLSLLATVACVDEFSAYNPPRALDAPVLSVGSTGSNQVLIETVTNRYLKNLTGYVAYGEPIQYSVAVLRAAGKVASVSVAPSVPDFGTVTLNEAGVNALIGKESGEFTFTFTPNPTLVDGDDRAFNLVVSVADAQETSKVSTISIPVTMVSCVDQTIATGTYTVTQASGNLDGGAPYTLASLETDNGGPVQVSLTKVFPGRYRINEVTAGIWPLYYAARANPEVTLNLCGNTIEGKDTVVGGLREFTVDGTLNNDGSISITWSYIRIVGTTPANPAMGTYTLVKD
jgi:hypothetical protein